MKVNDKVFVTDWEQIYNTFKKWDNNRSSFIFPWKTELPHYISQSNDTVVTTPKLTQKGEPFKNGDTIEISRVQSHKDYEYTILEIINHPTSGKLIYLISSNHTDNNWLKVYAQICEGGLTAMTPEEQEKVKHLQNTARLQALAKDNIGKWKIGDNIKDNFPKELFDVYYDTEQRVQFGSTMSKGIVTYEIMPKEYTIDNIAIYWCSSVFYNGEGCDLTAKKTTNWEALRKMCTNQNFR